MGFSKYRKAVAALAAEYGRTVEYTGGGHFKLVAEGKRSIFCSATPRNPVNNLSAIRRDIERYGT